MIILLKIKLYYKANKIKKAIIKEKSAIASVKAKPKIAILNNSSFNEGFLEIPITNAPKTVPIPTPLTGCPGTLHACSYSTAPQEIMCIPNAQLCDVYVIMITNFANQAGTVTFTQTNSGGGTTACFPINTFNYSQTNYCQNHLIQIKLQFDIT